MVCLCMYWFLLFLLRFHDLSNWLRLYRYKYRPKCCTAPTNRPKNRIYWSFVLDLMACTISNTLLMTRMGSVMRRTTRNQSIGRLLPRHEFNRHIQMPADDLVHRRLIFTHGVGDGTLAAVYGGGRHSWRLQMDSQLRKIDGKWLVTYSRASMY